MIRRSLRAFLALAFASCFAAPAMAQAAAGAAHAAAGSAPKPYADFVKGAAVESGLIPIIKKDGKTYLSLSTSQLGKDFIETSVPSSGLGGFGPAQGEPYVAPARIIHFDRVDDTVVLRWPNTYTITKPNTPESTGVAASLPKSVIAVVPIVAENADTVVIPAAPFLGDVADLAASFNQLAHNMPAHGYRLDPARSFFSKAKAFPLNDVLHVDQTWQSLDPNAIDNAPDPRSVEVNMTYNLIAAPNDGYVPRVADPRVGYFSQPLIDFASDRELQRTVNYITRWNFGKRTSAAPVQAANPIVFYLSNDIPFQYRDTVKKALLTWNDAFKPVGILNAVEVRQQPNDPSWDPEDLRHNMIRWIDTSSPQFGAEALLITDPRTGEELNIGVNFDAIEGLGGRTYKFIVAPARGVPDTAAGEHAYVENFIRSIILHESGHDLGLQHNFIGSMAYTAKDLQSKSFTNAHGVASSVMEYSPLNIWPKGTPQGDYDQLVLGPYDYYAVHYGYGYIPASDTPAQERATLKQWASKWSDPSYRFASDEDADGFASGHSVDPRVVTFDLTNKPLAWCGTQMTLMHSIMNRVAQRFPSRGRAFDEARMAFMAPMVTYLRCAAMPAHTIGGEYLSRSDAGDPGATAPLTPVSLAAERAAWNMLDSGLFADAPWRFNRDVLDRLTYSEYSSLSTQGTWAYDPTPRHDVPVVAIVGAAQNAALNELFSPLRLARIDDLGTKYAPGKTMTLADLFDWARNGIFGSISSGHAAADGPVRRNLQVAFAKRLADMWTAPKPGTPADAQALARLQLVDLRHAAAVALQRGHVDELTQAHLAQLQAIAQQALDAKATIAAPAAVAPGIP